jgi:redox-sensitive bicupin YhaK (pirin superfamily)
MDGGDDELILQTVSIGPATSVAPWPTLDPFLFCVHHADDYPPGDERMAPAASLAGRDIGQDFAGKDGWRMYHGDVVPGFPQHPHRGFETVTIARQGLIDHSDSLGATARFGQGDVQWLTAGAGIVHSEMFPLLRRDARNPAELFQIWLNLPRASKMAKPHFSMLWSESIPRHAHVDEAGRRTEITVVAGALGPHVPPAPPPESWASRPESDLAIWSIRMAAGARVELPRAIGNDTLRTLYFFRGRGLTLSSRSHAGEHTLSVRHAAVVRADRPLAMVAGDEAVEILVLQGRPIGEPVVQYGPFVMNSKAEIQQAFADYQRTRFGGWPWKDDAPVHGRDEGRFARRPDGSVERP